MVGGRGETRGEESSVRCEELIGAVFRAKEVAGSKE